MTLVYRILLMDFGGGVGKTFYLCFHNLSFARIHCIQPVYLGGATRKMSEDSNIVWYGMAPKITQQFPVMKRANGHAFQSKIGYALFMLIFKRP